MYFGVIGPKRTDCKPPNLHVPRRGISAVSPNRRSRPLAAIFAPWLKPQMPADCRAISVDHTGRLDERLRKIVKYKPVERPE